MSEPFKDMYEGCAYEDSSSESTLLDGKERIQARRTPIRVLCDRYRQFAVLQVCLLVLYTTTFIALGYSRSCNAESQLKDALVYSPARNDLRFKKERFNATLIIDSIYNQPPSPEVDDAWNQLISNMNIAVPKSDLERIGTFSIPVPNQPGKYVAGLSVYHELHCLKRLRQYTWQDYYYPNMTAEEDRLNRLHADHCIDVLRQAILCHSDVSLFTLQWSEDTAQPRADFSHEHTCVDWQSLFQWAGERRVPDDVMSNLKHPRRGKAFPDGKGSWLGATEDLSPTIIEES